MIRHDDRYLKNEFIDSNFDLIVILRAIVMKFSALIELNELFGMRWEIGFLT